MNCGVGCRFSYHRCFPKYPTEGSAMKQRVIRQKSLFEIMDAPAVVQLPAAVREAVSQRTLADTLF
jgi:hypothetical protein